MKNMTTWRGYQLYLKEKEDLYWGSITEEELEAKIIRQGRRKIIGGIVDYRLKLSTLSINQKRDFQPQKQVDIKAELVKEQNRSKQLETNLTQEQNKSKQLEIERNNRPDITVKEYNELLADKGLSIDWKNKQSHLSDLEKKDAELTTFLTSQKVSNLTQLSANIQTTINKCSQLEKELDVAKKEVGNKQTQITTLTNENKELSKQIKILEKNRVVSFSKEDQQKLKEVKKDLDLILNKWKFRDTPIKSASEFLNAFEPWINKQLEQQEELKEFLKKQGVNNLSEVNTSESEKLKFYKENIKIKEGIIDDYKKEEGIWKNTETEYLKKIEELKKNKGTSEDNEELEDLISERDEAIREKKTLEQENLALNNRLNLKQQEVSNKDKALEKLKNEKDKNEVSLNKKITEKNSLITTLQREILELKKKTEAKEPSPKKLTILKKKWDKTKFNTHEKHSPAEWANSGYFYWGESKEEIEVMEDVANILTDLPPDKKYDYSELREILKKKMYTEKLEEMLKEIEEMKEDEEKEFDVFRSHYVQEWIHAWKKNSLMIKVSISLDVIDFDDNKFFPYLEKHKEKYNDSYTSKELAKIWNEIRDWLEKDNNKKFSVDIWKKGDIEINPVLAVIFPQLDPNEKYSFNDLKEMVERKINQVESEKSSVFLGSHDIEWWIDQWNEFPNSITIIIPQSDRLFPYLKKHKEKYDLSYNYKELNQVFEKEKDNMKEVDTKIEKIKKQIKSLKEERQRYLPDEEGMTTKWKADKEKELTKEIDELEREMESIKQAEKITEIRKTPRSIVDWEKAFQLTKPQMDKLHKLVEKRVITIDFEKILYTWEEVEEMLKKSLPLKKQTICSWWLEKKISDEDYFLLKKKGVDVDNEELAQKEVWELIDKYEAEPTAPKEKQTLKSWQDKGMFNEKKYELLLNIGVDSNQEFTLQEITNKLMEIILEAEKPVSPKSQKKQTIYRWFIERKVLDEDYILLKKVGVDTEKEELTLAQVNKLIIEYDTKE